MYNWPHHGMYKEGSNYNGGLRWDSGAGSAWFGSEVIPAGESRIYNTVWNWDADMYSRKRDWSVTAWGVDHADFTVEHVDGLESAHSPTYDDGMRSVPEPIEFPPPPPQTCWDSNFGAADSYGDACAGYAPNWCTQNNNGQYDTDTFVSELMCCVCGGGCDCDPDGEEPCDCTNPLDDGDDVTPTPDPDEEDDVTPTPDPEPVCYDNDENGTLYDRDGAPYNCAAYTQHPNYCGNYDDDDFQSMEICCACGGGCDCDPNDSACDCNGDGGDDEVDPTPEPEPLPPHEVEFNHWDTDNSTALTAGELQKYWAAQCDVEGGCWDTTGMLVEDACCNRDMQWLVSHYDQNENGSICVGEFFALFNDVNAGTVPWPEEEEEDVQPTPDEDDDVQPTPDEDDDVEPTPDEDDDVQPTPDEDDDDEPTPDEGEEVDPIPDEDDVEPTPDEDEDDEPTPDEGEEVDPIPDEDDVEPTPDEDEEMDNNDNAINSQEDFDNWAWTRDVPENDVLNCGFDIRNEWHNGYYLWAGQNCEIYDLWVRIYVARDAWENRKIWETSDMNCVEESCEDDECNALFKISPANPRLGVAFDGQGEEVNFRFETERWAPCVEDMTE